MTSVDACVFASPPVLAPFTLEPREVHVWCADLRQALSQRALFYALLSVEERNRASRFAFELDRVRFILARGVLRMLLGQYLDRPPGSVRLDADDNGKPRLASVPGVAPLRFNVTHSHDLALYAVAHGREVGIDVELARPGFSWQDIAKYACTAREKTMLQSLSVEKQSDVFFAIWTLKEAYAKAVGAGLRLSLDQIQVVERAGEIPRLYIPRNPYESHRWSLYTLMPAPGYVGALAAEGKPLNVRLLSWSWDLPRGLGSRSLKNRCGSEVPGEQES